MCRRRQWHLSKLQPRKQVTIDFRTGCSDLTNYSGNRWAYWLRVPCPNHTHTRLTALNIMYSKYASIIFKTRNWSKIMMITTYTGKRIIARPDYSGLQSPEPQRHSTILAKMQKKIEKKHYEIACYSQTVIILFACLLFISVHFFQFRSYRVLEYIHID